MMLKFGTSGLRGLVAEMTDQECYINTLGYLRYLIGSGQLQPPARVSLAGDLRSSTDRIRQAVGQAIQAAGCQVENCGTIPSPAVLHHALPKGQASIMVTGSHIPDDRNGIKFNTPTGEVLKHEESGILAEVEKVRSEDLSATFDQAGGLLPEAVLPLPPVTPEAEEGYIQRYLAFFPDNALAGRRIVVDQHSAVGRDGLVRILESLGAEVLAVGRSQSFVPKDTENITLADRNYFQVLAQRHHPFAIVSTDGDGDRPFVVDESGTFHPGDVLGAVVARTVRAKYAAVPVSANDAIDAYLAAAGIERVQTRIGSPFVIAALQKGIQASKLPVVGWEANGGFLLGSAITLNGRSLSALPTRDAVLPILIALLAACDHGSVSQLFAALSGRFTQAGLLDHFPAEISQRLLSALLPEDYGVIQLEFAGQHYRLLHADGHEEQRVLSYMPEAPLSPRAFWKGGASANRDLSGKKMLEKYYFTPAMGFAEITALNVIDGIRISFANHDVAHIRASGNAPQLRLYANADTQQRADDIIRFGLAEDGILRALEADIRMPETA